MILVQSQASTWHFQTPIMINTGINFPNISKALIWNHMASTKPHIWYVKMILVQSQVSRWHFYTPIMNNSGKNVPNISKALIWTHMATTKPHIWYIKMILVQIQVSRWHFYTPGMNNSGKNVSNIAFSYSSQWALMGANRLWHNTSYSQRHIKHCSWYLLYQSRVFGYWLPFPALASRAELWTAT